MEYRDSERARRWPRYWDDESGDAGDYPRGRGEYDRGRFYSGKEGSRRDYYDDEESEACRYSNPDESDDYAAREPYRTSWRGPERAYRGQSHYRADLGDYPVDRRRYYYRRYSREPYQADYEISPRNDAYFQEYMSRPRSSYSARVSSHQEDLGQRGWWDRATDEVASWFGDQRAEHRRHIDKLRGRGQYRGVGPKGYRRPDERIREDINDCLTEYDWLDATDIEVSVLDGYVTLSGRVRDRYSKRIAEELTDRISGVREVENRPGRSIQTHFRT
jgi:osmotically-inducible protein OsmY